MFLWSAFSLTVTALIFADYVPIFVFPVFWIMAFGVRNKSWRIKFLLAHTPILIFGILWLPTFILQLKHGSWLTATVPGWSEIAGGASFKQAALIWTKFGLGRISLTNKKLYYLLISLASLPLVAAFVSAVRRIKKGIVPVFYWLLVPLSLGFLAFFL